MEIEELKKIIENNVNDICDKIGKSQKWKTGEIIYNFLKENYDENIDIEYKNILLYSLNVLTNSHSIDYDTVKLLELENQMLEEIEHDIEDTPYHFFLASIIFDDFLQMYMIKQPYGSFFKEEFGITEEYFIEKIDFQKTFSHLLMINEDVQREIGALGCQFIEKNSNLIKCHILNIINTCDINEERLFEKQVKNTIQKLKSNQGNNDLFRIKVTIHNQIEE